MGLETSNMHEHGHLCHFKWMSWSAVIMGALVGIGLSFLFNLFNVAIGLTIFNVTPEGSMSLAVGGFIALLIGGIVSMFIAGWVAGYLGKPYCRCNIGLLYGFVTWTLALLITVLTMSQVGQYMAAFSNSISNQTIVNVTSDQNTPLVRDTGPRSVEVNANKAARTLGVSAFITFILFFIGAISACAGAYAAMACAEKCETDRGDLNRRDDLRSKL